MSTLLFSVNAITVGEAIGDWLVLCDPEQVAALDSTAKQIMRIDFQLNPPFSKAEITYISPLGISLYKFPILNFDGK
ncbi:MAG: hypothetical protein ACJAXW_004022 [Candidatus Azotimanducaceae bacterium]|jgi:hypothetical protein